MYYLPAPVSTSAPSSVSRLHPQAQGHLQRPHAACLHQPLQQGLLRSHSNRLGRRDPRFPCVHDQAMVGDCPAVPSCQELLQSEGHLEWPAVHLHLQTPEELGPAVQVRGVANCRNECIHDEGVGVGVAVEE